ncbi:unnamed protein product, partial [Ilex paraguariensis]
MDLGNRKSVRKKGGDPGRTEEADRGHHSSQGGEAKSTTPENGAIEEGAMLIGEAVDYPTSQRRKEMASTSTLPNPGNEKHSIEQRAVGEDH